MYRSPMDQAIAWLLVTAWIVVGLFGARRRFQGAISSEAYLLAASRALFTLCLFAAGVYVIGLIFLVWLKISSGFWLIWQLLFLMSVVAVFWVTPAVGIVLLCWALVGRKRLRHSSRALTMTARALAGIAADILLYYAIIGSIAYRTSQ